MIQPKIHQWHRFDAKTGVEYRMQHATSPFNDLLDNRYFQKNGEQRASIVVSGKTFYRE